MMGTREATIVGIGVSMTSYQEVIEAIDTRPKDRSLTVTACSVHGLMSAQSDPSLRRAFRDTDITTPDGMPLVWGIRMTQNRAQDRVYGPDLMKLALQGGGRLGWKHYLYGSTPSTLEALQQSIERFAPGAEIVGAWSPPFRDLTPDEESEALEHIRSSGADVVWVGLGMPKQELWMHQVRAGLPGVALVGVGAAFDFLAGTKRQAPSWMQRAGLEWLFRLVQEPRRLWRRYILNNPAFVFLLARQVVADRLSGRRGVR